MAQEVKKCSRDATWCKSGLMPISHFINEKGLECKMCPKCRERSRVQNSKQENKEKLKEWKKHNKPTSEQTKNYTETYRSRKLEKDPVGYRKHLAEKQRLNKNTKLTTYKTHAAERNLAWDLVDEEAKEFFTKPCVWCGVLKDGTLNGIDRLDSKQGYTLNNCVACCANCNHMKGCFDPATFIEKCKNILEYVSANPIYIPENVQKCINNYKKEVNSQSVQE